MAWVVGAAVERNPRVRGVVTTDDAVVEAVRRVLAKSTVPLGPQVIAIEAHLPDTRTWRGRVSKALTVMERSGEVKWVGKGRYALTSRLPLPGL